MVGSDPVEAVEDIRDVPRAVAVEDADRHDVDLRCHAVVGAADGARHMGPVPVAVIAAVTVDRDATTHETRTDAAFELRVVAQHAGVDDVRGDPSTAAGVTRRRCRVHHPVERQVALVEAIEAP